MLKDCIAIFEKELNKKGDRLIIDNHLPADGTYIIVSKKDNKFVIEDVVDIKYDKKTDEIKNRDNIYFKDICEYDYNSRLIDMNKPIDSKKIIHSNNYLSFFIKKENLTNGKLTNEIIDNYYNILSDPSIKYTKKKAKEIYSIVDNKLDKINQELLEEIKVWIKENIFSLDKFNIDLKRKDYLKIFFEAPIEIYQNECNRYVIPNIYNNNDFNLKVQDLLYGLPNNNINLNSKKPYLENKSRKIKIPYLIDENEVLIQKKFFDYLNNLASKGYVNIYLSDEYIESRKNAKLLDNDFTGLYLRLKKGKEVEIYDYDVITSYKPTLKKPFKLLNILEIDEKFINGEYKVYKKREDFQKVINEILFSKYLVNNYYTDSKDISIKDNVLKRNLLISRDKIFNFIYKGDENGVYKILDKTSSNLIKNNINNGYIVKASHQFNFKYSLDNYLKGGKSMADIIYDIKNNLRVKINLKNTDVLENDKEYYFAVGQLISYLLSKSKSKNKKHSLLNPFINAKNNDVIKEKLKNLYKKYNYDIDEKNLRVKNLYAMIVSYEVENKVDQDMIIAGYLHSNLIYESNKEE